MAHEIEGAYLFDESEQKYVGVITEVVEMSGGHFIAHSGPIVCAGCGSGDVMTEVMPTYRLCRSCMDISMAWFVIERAFDRVVDMDDVLGNAVQHLTEADAGQRNIVPGYATASESAWDWDWSSPDERANLDRIITMINTYIAQRVT